ncbi:Uncharacterised protein [Actinobacillus ureae]|uniref:hypothetical protein n=1 Tax=Actinobacillus ureae TaxID=723 RepID=UPI000E150F13|nr:hypothetical protein [Actinobacillus ureae]SUT86427.1 Uncharacterised protein [Actinobacillus ureae]SUU45838.1 Uncharacterised protein [Actinobacillus ureae]
MKKLFALALTAVSVSSYAETKPAVNTQPMLRMQVLDMSSNVPSPVANNQLSLSKKHQLCWVAFNMPFKASNQVVEVLQAPSTLKVTSEDGNVVSTSDQQTHRITTLLKSSNNERLDKCWGFEKTDPTGKYSLTIQVNDVVFPPQPFEVVK